METKITNSCNVICLNKLEVFPQSIPVVSRNVNTLSKLEYYSNNFECKLLEVNAAESDGIIIYFEILLTFYGTSFLCALERKTGFVLVCNTC